MFTGNIPFVRARTLVAGLALVAVPPLSRAAAQPPETTASTSRSPVIVTATADGGTILGDVRDGALEMPLQGVLVQLPALSRAVRTDSSGRFVLRAVPSGRWQVVFARIGYAPRIAIVSIARDSGAQVAVRLSNRLELAPVQVSAAAQATTPIEAPQAMAVLGEETLRLAQSTSLGETVARAPGMRVLTMSTGIGKPIIRGLSSQRVITLDNGQRVESQQWGTDHAPTMETQGAERIEIIKGPASVLYGSDAIGGVINVIARPLPEARDSERVVRWESVVGWGDNPRGHDMTLLVEGGSASTGWRAGFTQRGLGDMRTPAGLLRNSANRTDAIQLAGAVRGRAGVATLRATRRDESIRILENPAVDPTYTGHQHITSERVKLELRTGAPFGHLTGDFSYEGNVRLEYASSDAQDVTLGLLARTGATTLQWHHEPVGRWVGLVGVSASAQQFRKRGLTTLIPDASASNIAIFAFEQARYGPLSLAIGGRWDDRRIAAADDAVLELESTSRRWSAVSGNFGATWNWNDRFALLASVARGFRSPWYHELFANGFHEGTRAHETGNPNLRVETSANVDAGFRMRLDDVTMDIGAFSNRVRNYVYMQPIGLPGRRYDSLRVAQGDAWLRGAEIDLHVRAQSWLELEGGADLTIGDNRTTGEPLPAIPSMRSLWALRFSMPRRDMALRQPATIELREERHWQQTRLHANELATPAYTLHHVTGTLPFAVAGRDGTLDLMVRNVADVRFRSFLSRYKEFADGAGRSVQVRVTLEYR